MTLKSVLDLNKRVVNRRSDKQIDVKDYDKRVADLENPDEIVETILARLRQASDFREPWEEKWRRAFMAWMQILDTEIEDSWESKRYMPLILKHVETALPSIAATVFNGKDIWDIRGMTPNGRDAADALSKLVHWQARGPSRMEQSFDEGAFFAVLFGTAFFDVGWSLKKEVRPVPIVINDYDADTGEFLQDENGEMVPAKIVADQEVRVEDWPYVNCINPTSVWACPYGEAGDNNEWYLLLRETTSNKLKAAAGHGHLDKEAIIAWEEEFYGDGAPRDPESDDLFESAQANLWNEWMAEAELEEREEGYSDDFHNGDKVVKLLVYRSKSETITLAPGKRIIGYSENPNMHGKTGIIDHQFIPVPGCPYGRGLGTVLLDQQELANENMNLFMDVAKISAMGPIVVNRNSISTMDRNFVWSPNKIIQARDVNNSVKRVEAPPPTNLAMMLNQSLENSASEITGFSEQARGMSPSGVNTATEFSGLQQNIATRAFMHVRRLRRTVGLIGKMLVQLNQQYMTEEQVVAVVGEDGMAYHSVQPWQIVGEVDVLATASVERANPAMKAQQMIGATQVIIPLLQQGKGDPFIMRWIRELLDAIGIEGADTMIPKNYGKNNDPIKENIALRQGVAVEAYPSDNHGEHITLHTKAMQEAEAEEAHEAVLVAFQEHISKHMMAAQPQNVAPSPGAEGGSPERQEAQALGAAQGSNGQQGAAPGPQAAPGRPI